jgi:hypothetical protein
MKNNIIILSLCDGKDTCGRKDCYHKQPHTSNGTCKLFQCGYSHKTVICRKKNYKLVEV